MEEIHAGAGKRHIKVATDFSKFPGGRYRSDGDHSGQRLREDLLAPALRQAGDEPVTVELDGTLGFPSSFLEEAFGGLVRESRLGAVDIEKLTLVTSNPALKGTIERFIKDAQQENA